MEITPTMNFSGKCREAIRLYEKALGGKIACMIAYREANDPTYLPFLTEEQKDFIYHAVLTVGSQRIIMSGQTDLALPVCWSNFLTVMFDGKEEVQRACEIMKAGSETIYPMEATPYSACRVAFVDRFGIRWGLMTEKTE